MIDDRLKRLLTISGVSGFEDAVREYLVSELPESVDYRIDRVGNLIVKVGEGSPALLYVAHMDEIGFLVTGICDDGFLKFQRIGTIDASIVAGTSVTVHTKNGHVPGVIGIRPPHLGGGQGLEFDSLVIDVGVDSRQEAVALGVEPLQSVSFVRTPVTMAQNNVNCRTLDDRFGCYVLLKACHYAASANVRGSVTFVWSVQEEVGLRGARALANELNFDVAIPVDAYATSVPSHGNNSYTPVALGGGPVLRMFDHGSIASLPLAQWLTRIAADSGITIQAGSTGGETDGVPLQESGAHMVPLAVGIRYLHSLAETANLDDIENCAKLLNCVIDRLTEIDALV